MARVASCLNSLLLVAALSSPASGVIRDVSRISRDVRTRGRWHRRKPAYELEIPEGLLAGCSSIFVDVGSNLGVHVRMLFEPEMYPKDGRFLRLLDEAFGDATQRKFPSNESGICAVAFEGNPKFRARHQAIEEAYRSRGWRAVFLTPVVASTEDGTAAFYMSTNPEDTEGSSTLDRNAENPAREFNATYLQALDLARFLEPYKDAKVFMKMDIEGGEFTLMPHLLKAGMLCSTRGIDQMIVEEHSRILNARGDSYAPWPEILKRVQFQQDCEQPTTIIDDPEAEIYWEDPVPLMLTAGE